jgi:hypothetical protein
MPAFKDDNWKREYSLAQNRPHDEDEIGHAGFAFWIFINPAKE